MKAFRNYVFENNSQFAIQNDKLVWLGVPQLTIQVGEDGAEKPRVLADATLEELKIIEEGLGDFMARGATAVGRGIGSTIGIGRNMAKGFAQGIGQGYGQTAGRFDPSKDAPPPPPSKPPRDTARAKILKNIETALDQIEKGFASGDIVLRGGKWGKAHKIDGMLTDPDGNQVPISYYIQIRRRKTPSMIPSAGSGI